MRVGGPGGRGQGRDSTTASLERLCAETTYHSFRKSPRGKGDGPDLDLTKRCLTQGRACCGGLEWVVGVTGPESLIQVRVPVIEVETGVGRTSSGVVTEVWRRSTY